MKLHAVTTDGDIVPISKIVSWIGTINLHIVSLESIQALLQDAGESGRMTISRAGIIDGFNQTPIFTAGQRSVKSLYDEGNLLWNIKTGIICKSKQTSILP